ncbi:hypothetical protein BH23VER1_BH23VER1_24280 [soil metagenome]
MNETIFSRQSSVPGASFARLGLIAAVVVASPALSHAQLLLTPNSSTDLTGLNTNNGFYNALGGLLNTANGNVISTSGQNNVANGGYHDVSGANMRTATSSFFNATHGFNNSALGSIQWVGGQNNVATGTGTFIYGSRMTDNGLPGGVIFSDLDPRGNRAAGGVGPGNGHQFNAIFHGGHHLMVDDSGFQNGLFVIPSDPDAAGVGQDGPAFVGINTGASPSEALEVNGNTLIRGRATVEGNLVLGGILDALGSVAVGSDLGVVGPATFYSTVGINTTSPNAALDVGGGLMAVTGSGGAAAIDLAPVNLGADDPGTRIQGTGGETFGAHLDFMTKQGGSVSNPLTNRMRITSDGRVGIGTETPTEATLVVDGSASQDLGPYAILTFFNNDSTVGSNRNGGAAPRSIHATTNIAATEFHAFSDRRIKNVIGQSERGNDLASLLAIEVTDYTLIDEVAHGSRQHKKVVAQQVESILPNAVTCSVGTIPDVFQMAALTGGWIELDAGLELGERVRLIGGKQSGVHEVLELREGAFCTSFESDADEVFVYGREVDDFRSVDYEAIAMLNVSATQELHRIIQQKQLRIADMESRLAALEERDAARAAQVAAILARLEEPATTPAALGDPPAEPGEDWAVLVRKH